MQQLPKNILLQGGKYKIEKVLGQGGFGITYLATQEFLDRKVCVKEFFLKDSCARTSTGTVTLGMVGNKDMVERFLNKFIKEARTISKLDYPNIIRILDVFMENGTAYYVMDFIEGESLEDIVRRRGALPEHEAIGYIKQVANALDYLHQHRINHLDVKPANIMIRRNDNKAILIDFGVSKQYDSQGEQTSTTPVGISYGYAPIEQYRPGGVSEFSPQADIYALGATLYRLVIGITPPQAIEIFNEGLLGLPQSLSSNLASTIRKSMQPHGRSRLQSVNEFLYLLNVPSEQIVEPEITENIENEFDPNKIDEYYILAEGGNLIAQIYLGDYYIQQNDGTKALLWFEKAAQQNSPKAQFNIGLCYELGLGGIEKDYTKAVVWYTKAAEQGGFISQFRLGRLYFLGWGIQQDHTKAASWFKKSAEQGYDESQYFLGICYELGCGVEQNFIKASEWTQKAANQGHEEANKKVEKQKQEEKEASYSEAIKLYNEAKELAGKGNNEAYNLYNRAFRMFLTIALHGDADAQFYVAYCYSNGLGVDKNDAQAVEWYRRSSEQGNTASQNNLGVCYGAGEGVSQDKKIAAEWFKRAAEQGDDCAQCNLADYYKDGIGVEKNLKLAVKWYKKSAEQGYERAIQNLADCYYYGKGIDNDKDKAIELYQTLADKGNEKAIETITRIEEEKKYAIWVNSWKGKTYHFLGKLQSLFLTPKLSFVLMLLWIGYLILTDTGLIKDFIGLPSKIDIFGLIINTDIFGVLFIMSESLCFNYLKSLREIFGYESDEIFGSISLSIFYLICIIGTWVFMIWTYI